MSDSAAPARGGVVEIIVATAIGGGAGYALTIIAGISLGAVGYATFAVYWSALYLVVGAISGIQQEVARAAHPSEPVAGARSVARNFALVAAAGILAVTVATSPLWSPVVFPGEGFVLVVPLALGAAAYAVVAVLAGVLYGLRLWRFIAALIIVDGLLRLGLVVAVLSFTSSLVVVAWAVALPFMLTPLLVWLFVRRRVVGRFALDVAYRALTWNVARTVVGAAALGILVSGFPLILGATSGGDSRASIAAIVFATNLTRAPIIIVVLALQSYLIVYFRTRSEHFWRYLGAIIGAVLAVTLLATVLVAAVGPWLLRTFFSHDYVLSAGVLAALVGSAGAVAVLCATGPLLLALGRHGYYTAGWVAAAATTVLALLLPLGLTERAIIALWAGPIVGLVVQFAGIVFGRSRSVVIPLF